MLPSFTVSVSATTLLAAATDVYKRQVSGREQSGYRGCARPEGQPFQDPVPVSYTHLDVYKRQVVKDLEGRMNANKELRYHIAAYTSTKNVAQQFKTAKRPAAFEELHRVELTAYRAAAAYFKANDLTKLPSPKKLEVEYAQLASETAKFYEQYKEAKEELFKLKTAKQNVASFFRCV